MTMVFVACNGSAPVAPKEAPAEVASPQMTDEAAAEPTGDPSVFGVIEIGGSGVKPSLVRIAQSSHGELEPDEVATLDDVEANAHDPEQVAVVAQAVKVVAATMRSAHDVPAENIYVLGSSGIKSQDHSEQVRTAVNAAVKGLAQPLKYITTEEEGVYGFEGVVNCVSLAHRRKQVLFIDIGSSNTKGTYAKDGDTKCGSELMGSFPMPYGTKVLADEAASQPGRYTVALETVRQERLDKDMAAIVENHRGVSTRSRIYLGGGIAWSLATITHPEDGERYVRLTTDDIGRFQAQLQDDPSCIVDVSKSEVPNDECKYLDVDLSRVADARRREEAKDDYLKVVEKVFTEQELMAGVEILDAMVDNWGFEGKAIFFARPARRAWMVGYILKDRGTNIAFYRPDQ